MEQCICPLCNGLDDVLIYCNQCNEKMIDGGKISFYYDNYAPSLPEEVTADRMETSNYCTHLFYCLQCHDDQRVVIDKKCY